MPGYIKSVLGIGFNLLGSAFMKYFPDTDWLSHLCFVVGCVLFLWAIPEWISKERGWSFVSNWKFNHVMPFKVLIPLDKAAKLYYEEVTRINHADIINALDDNVLTGRDMRLDFMAAQLADGAQLHGRRPLSRLIQPLSFDSTPTIGMNGSSIVDNSQKPVYTDLKIERRHFKNKMNSLTCKTK